MATSHVSRWHEPGLHWCRRRIHVTGRVYAGVALVASTMVLARAGAVARQTPRARPEAAGLSAARLRDATDLLNRYVSEHRIAGAVAAVARRGQVAYLEAVGVQDLETRAPMTERSLFRIYSMTKSGDSGGGHDAARRAPLRSRRRCRHVHPRIQERHGVRRTRRRTAPAGAADHRPGSSAAHLRPQPSNVRDLSSRAGADAGR